MQKLRFVALKARPEFSSNKTRGSSFLPLPRNLLMLFIFPSRWELTICIIQDLHSFKLQCCVCRVQNFTVICHVHVQYRFRYPHHWLRNTHTSPPPQAQSVWWLFGFQSGSENSKLIVTEWLMCCSGRGCRTVNSFGRPYSASFSFMADESNSLW